MDPKDDRDLAGAAARGAPAPGAAEGRDPAPKAPRGAILSVHLGRSANCSSVGSVVDVLFMSSVAGTAILGALAVYLGSRAEDTEAELDPDSDGLNDLDAGAVGGDDPDVDG